MMIRQRLRGIAGTAAIWAALAVPLALAHAGISAAFGKPTPPSNPFAPLLAGVLIRGALTGAVFAGLLATMARGRSFGSLRLADTARWGALGSLVAPLVVIALSALPHAARIPASLLLSTVAQTALVGALCGVGTVAIARRAPDVPALPDKKVDRWHLPA